MLTAFKIRGYSRQAGFGYTRRLKLDHRGDFLIGLPALEQLRSAFPNDHITLICGSWNADTARRLSITDDIRTDNYFPENVQQWNGTPLEDISRFREVSKGRFDIALDLRVDKDTRPLLNHVDASLRCGIGSRSRHPYLNIALPDEFETREVVPVEAESVVLNPNVLQSRMPTQTPFFYETDFSVTDMHLIYGHTSDFHWEICGPNLGSSCRRRSCSRSAGLRS